jgi:hypothetical protein
MPRRAHLRPRVADVWRALWREPRDERSRRQGSLARWPSPEVAALLHSPSASPTTAVFRPGPVREETRDARSRWEAALCWALLASSQDRAPIVEYARVKAIDALTDDVYMAPRIAGLLSQTGRTLAGAGVLLGLSFGGCTLKSVDERDYTQRNQEVLGDVPAFPGATLQSSYSAGSRSGNGWLENSGRYTSFHTERIYTLPPDNGAEQVLSFYESELDEHWTLRAFTTCERTFRNGRASLFVSACHESLRMSVDHNAYGN